MRKDAAAIELRAATGTTTITRDDVYFTFADGRLAYDCVTCSAKCCRGFGYLITSREGLGRHLELRRALPLFVSRGAKHDAHHAEVKNCAPGCFFLADDGNCEVHAEHGYEA